MQPQHSRLRDFQRHGTLSKLFVQRIFFFLKHQTLHLLKASRRLMLLDFCVLFAAVDLTLVIRLNPIMLLFFTFIHSPSLSLSRLLPAVQYLLVACWSTHALGPLPAGDIGPDVARLNRKCKEEVIPSFRRPSIWFCLVKARRDGTLQ